MKEHSRQSSSLLLLVVERSCRKRSGAYSAANVVPLLTPERHRDGYFEARPSDVVREALLIIDVRDEEAIAAEHIHGVRAFSATTAIDEGLPLDKDARFAIVCSNGVISRDVARALTQTHGFANVTLLVGGMRRWIGEDRPVSRAGSWRPLET